MAIRSELPVRPSGSLGSTRQKPTGHSTLPFASLGTERHFGLWLERHHRTQCDRICGLHRGGAHVRAFFFRLMHETMAVGRAAGVEFPADFPAELDRSVVADVRVFGRRSHRDNQPLRGIFLTFILD
jgi:hypothetical protein